MSKGKVNVLEIWSKLNYTEYEQYCNSAICNDAINQALINAHHTLDSITSIKFFTQEHDIVKYS